MYDFFDFFGWGGGGFGDPLYGLIIGAIFAILDLIFYFL